VPSGRALARAWSVPPIQLNRYLALARALEETAGDSTALPGRRVWRAGLVQRLDSGLQWSHLAQLRVAELDSWALLAACEALAMGANEGTPPVEWQARAYTLVLSPMTARRDPHGTAAQVLAHLARVEAAAARLGIVLPGRLPAMPASPQNPLRRATPLRDPAQPHTPLRAFTPLVAGVDYDPDTDE